MRADPIVAVIGELTSSPGGRSLFFPPFALLRGGILWSFFNLSSARRLPVLHYCITLLPHNQKRVMEPGAG